MKIKIKITGKRRNRIKERGEIYVYN